MKTQDFTIRSKSNKRLYVRAIRKNFESKKTEVIFTADETFAIKFTKVNAKNFVEQFQQHTKKLCIVSA